MRMTLLTTVAAAALSLSAAAIAQTGTTSGSTSTTSGTTTGTTGTGTGTTGGGTGTTGSGTGTPSGTTAPRPPAGAAGTTSGTTGTSTGTTTTTGTAGAAGTSAGASINLSTEQRTQAVTTLRSVNVPTVQENVTISVGQPVPTTVTTLVDCPTTLESLITGVRDCKVVRVGNRYYIVEGSSRRVVTTIEAQ